MVVFVNIPVWLGFKLQISVDGTSLHVILHFESIQVFISFLLFFKTNFVSSYFIHCNFFIKSHRRITQTLKEFDVFFSVNFLKLSVFNQKVLLVFSKTFIKWVSDSCCFKPRSLRIESKLTLCSHRKFCLINFI